MRLQRALGRLALAGAASPVAASEGGGGGGALISPEPGLVIWTIVTFVLLVLMLGRFAWKPLLKAIQDRERTIQDDLERARRDRDEAESTLEEHRSLVAQARREHAEAVAAGQRDAERLKAEIIDEGKRQREQILAQTQAQVEAEMRQARAEVRGMIADLGIRAAEKLLSANLDDATQRRLVEEYLADLERDPDGSGAKPS